MSKGNRLYTYYSEVHAFLLYPVLFAVALFIGLYLSMTDWTLGRKGIHSIGLKNFQLHFSDPELLRAVLLSTRLNPSMRLNNGFRTIFHLPVLAAGVNCTLRIA